MKQPSALHGIVVAIFLSLWFGSACAVDVRILIDVSGSMKENDPNNLRVPAVRLISELLPPGAHAGIWLFAEQPASLVELGQVTESWKSISRERIGQIHSRGQFTNIEAVLKEATADWRGEALASNAANTNTDKEETPLVSRPDAIGTSSKVEAADQKPRHLILLTDGVVDVSKDATESAQSRHRITTELLDEIKALDAQVHAIALSKSSDRDLLTTLSTTTDGWSKEVASAGELQRVFLHMFEKAAQPESVPLVGNRFQVDSSIHEMTLLVFKTEESNPTTLTGPNAQVFSQNTRSEDVAWIAEQQYDLITIQKPTVGDWKINAALDPDNRVLIVTDMKMRLNEIPTNVLVDEDLHLGVGFYEKDSPVERTDFLKLITVKAAKAHLSESDENEHVLRFNDATKQFEMSEIVDWPVGEYELVVTADSGTFKRQQRRRIDVFDTAIKFSHELIEADGARTITLNANAVPELVEIESLVGLAIVTDEEHRAEIIEFGRFDADGKAMSSFAVDGGESVIWPRVVGRAKSGRAINLKAEPISIAGNSANRLAEPVSGASIEKARSIDWIDSGIVIAAGNGIALLIFLPLWFFTRRGAKKVAAEVNVT